MVGGEAGLEVHIHSLRLPVFELSTSAKRGNRQALLLAFPDMRQEAKKEKWSLKAVSS